MGQDGGEKCKKMLLSNTKLVDICDVHLSNLVDKRWLMIIYSHTSEKKLHVTVGLKWCYHLYSNPTFVSPQYHILLQVDMTVVVICRCCMQIYAFWQI